MEDELEKGNQQLPMFLRIIGTLSVINGIYGMLSSLLNAVSPVEVNDQLLQDLLNRLEQLKIPFENLRDDLESYYLNTLLQMENISAASFLFYSLSLFGAIMMLRRRLNGFWLYAFAQIALAFIPSFFGGFNTFGWSSFAVMLVWNGIWVSMYASQLKWLREP